MFSHIFIETNWLVDYAAPEGDRSPAALQLLERAASGECRLYLPVICLAEAKVVLPRRFPLTSIADRFRRLLFASGIGAPDREVTLRVLDQLESIVDIGLKESPSRLAGLQSSKGLEILPMTEASLQLQIDLALTTGLKAYDLAILSIVLAKAAGLREESGTAAGFCTTDKNFREESVTRVCARYGVEVLSSFEL